MRKSLVAALTVHAFASPVALAASDPALSSEVARAEQALYAAVFDRCDADAVAGMVAPDLEFFHDKAGQVAKSRAELVTAVRASCDNQRAGKEARTRRVPVANTLKVHRMGQYGALAVGVHRFYHLPEGKPPVPTEHARYANLWRKEGDAWLLARVFSYEHVASSSPDRPR